MEKYKIIKVFGKNLYLSGLKEFSEDAKKAIHFDDTTLTPELYILNGKAGDEPLEIITLYQYQTKN